MRVVLRMETNRRSALGAFTLGLTASLFVACSAATPSASPSAPGPSGAPSTSPVASAQASATPSPTPAPTPTPTPAITPMPTPRSGSLSIAWTKVASAAAGPGLRNTDYQSAVATLGDVMVVAQDSQGELPGPAFWYSEDGRTWTEATVSEPLSESIWVADMTVGGPGLVAVGGAYVGDPNDPTTEVAIWTSSDGRSWTRVKGPALGPGELHKVGTTVGGLIAFGGDGTEGAIWTSPDGTDWSRAAVPSGFAPWDVTLAESDGALLAFDVRTEADDSPIDEWRADSLTQWTRLGTLPHSAGQRLAQVVHGPTGWVASGGVFLASTDGVTWSVVPKPPDAQAVVADAGGFIGVDFRITSSGCVYDDYDTINETWTSADGRTWLHLPEDPRLNHGSINALLIRGETLYGFGLGYTSGKDARAVVWTADLAGFGAPSGPLPTPTPTPKPSHTPPTEGCGGP